MFQLNAQEKEELVTKCHRFQSMKHATVFPYVFTEHGVIMLASVLNSDRAVKMSIYIVKTFVRLREILSTNRELAQKLDQLEQKTEKHDQAIRNIFDAIRRLMVSESDYYKRTKIGFIVNS